MAGRIVAKCAQLSTLYMKGLPISLTKWWLLPVPGQRHTPQTHLELRDTRLILTGGQAADTRQGGHHGLGAHRLPLGLIEYKAFCFSFSVLGNESGHIEFCFSSLAYVTVLTLAQSGPAQDWVRVCSGLLTLRTISDRLRRSMHNYFNLSRGSPELVPYRKMAKWAPSFESEWFLRYLAFATTSRTYT
jgi:hypothetical protein